MDCRCVYRLSIRGELGRRFCLSASGSAMSLGQDSVWPCLALAPIGWTWSLYFAQPPVAASAHQTPLPNFCAVPTSWNVQCEFFFLKCRRAWSSMVFGAWFSHNRWRYLLGTHLGEARVPNEASRRVSSSELRNCVTSLRRCSSRGGTGALCSGMA